MGLYIPGIEMPKHCGCCKAAFPDGVGFSCCMIKGYPPIDNQRGRRPNCPIHELPPHGDLIDIRTVLEIVMQYVPDDDGSCSKANADLRELLDAIENVPVVIPAERSDDT